VNNNNLAYHDTLTGLPNRIFLNDHLGEAITEAGLHQHKLAVLFIDLDRFKIVNDTFGHGLGDLLLKQVANRLLSCVRKQDIVARQGGDEFILLLQDISYAETEQIARRVIQSLAYPLILSENEVYITPSVGISFFPSDGIDAETLIKYADQAMYKAKEIGKNNFQFFTEEINEQVFKKSVLENQLRKAVEEGELEVYYQPQVDVKTNRIVSTEALLRWHHPENGWISPGDFIPLAEETGLIAPLGELVLGKACKQTKLWRDKGHDLSISVNLSNRQLLMNNVVDTIKKSLLHSKLDPKHVTLEITESLAIMNMTDTRAKLQQLEDLG
jgi:diguanylate cyclase (GGDEF)-like protein